MKRKATVRPAGTARTPAAQGAARPRSARVDPAVEALLAELDHPLAAEIRAVRKAVLDASPDVSEGLKWNSASFRTHEWFATIHLRSKDAVQLVFHRGAKARDGSKRMAVEDPQGLLRWLSSDRGLVTVGAGPEVARRRAALQALVRAWTSQL